MKTILVLAAGLLSVSNAEAARICHAIGCQNGVYLKTPVNYRWARGKYRFEFVLDGKKSICTGSLPLPPCGQRDVVCDNADIRIGESGCALPPEQHGFYVERVASLPGELSVRIFRDDKLIGSADGTPEYKVVQPNGLGCAPVCTVSALEIELR